LSETICRQIASALIYFPPEVDVDKDGFLDAAELGQARPHQAGRLVGFDARVSLPNIPYVLWPLRLRDRA